MAPIILTDRELARFNKYLKRDLVTGCLLWVGQCNLQGYGRFWYRGRLVRATHVVLGLKGREVPEGHEVMHQCPHGDNPTCCEGAHLITGSRLEHARDRSRKGQQRKSRQGLPFGAFRQKNGNFTAQARIGGSIRRFGTYATANEASAVARAAKAADLATHHHPRPCTEA
jgi:hypothetical protein